MTKSDIDLKVGEEDGRESEEVAGSVYQSAW